MLRHWNSCTEQPSIVQFNAFADGIRWHLDGAKVVSFLRLFLDAWAVFLVEALKPAFPK
jgi:hypothetical protein